MQEQQLFTTFQDFIYICTTCVFIQHAFVISAELFKWCGIFA
jgi:hypothetical protein